MTVTQKMTLSCVAAFSILTVGCLYVQYHHTRKNGIDHLRDNMRTAVLDAETARENAAKKVEAGAYDMEKLLAELKEVADYRDSTLYTTVPVVSAWQSLNKTAEEKGYEFRVINPHPRNRKNKPQGYETEILKRFKETGAEEDFFVDQEKGRVFYARPVHLSQDCLSCHGDPRTSPTGDGMDILGFPMEDWDEGQLVGAFVLSSDMKPVETAIQKSTMETIYVAVPLALICLGVLFYVLQKAVVNPLGQSLGDTIADVAGLTGQISNSMAEIRSSSELAANGASKQAAALEETSASLQEISDASAQNREECKSALDQAQECATLARTSEEGMRSLTTAMTDIKRASGEVAEIIKSIDEIAFQTNILALNAAVEAARAGEAGAGFSVVADEVRNLAHRASQAAKQTSERIENSVGKSNQGFEICQSVTADLVTVVKTIESVRVGMETISSSSEEQSEGMRQITAAVTDIDEVIQSSAAGAEETSSTIHEVNEQIAALRDVVGKLAKLSGRAKSEMESANYGSAAHAGRAANDHVGSFEPSTSANFFVQQSGNPDESGDVGFFETQPHANGNRLGKDPALFS